MATLRADGAGEAIADSTPRAQSSKSNSFTQSASPGLKRAHSQSSARVSSTSSSAVTPQPTPPATSKPCSLSPLPQYKVCKNKAKHTQQASSKTIVTRSMVYFGGLPDTSPHQSILNKGSMASHIATNSGQRSTTNATVTRDMFQPQGLPSYIRI